MLNTNLSYYSIGIKYAICTPPLVVTLVPAFNGMEIVFANPNDVFDAGNCNIPNWNVVSDVVTTKIPFLVGV